MFLHRLHLDPRCREARRDMADPYQLHSTLCRAFSEPDVKCAVGEFLWRLDPEKDDAGCPRLLVQSRTIPQWSRIGVKGWSSQDPDPAIDLAARLKLDTIQIGQRFRFRLRANPCVTRNGKRLGLMQLADQENWIERKGRDIHGFSLPAGVCISQEQMLRGKRHDGGHISVFSVLYDGVLSVTEPVRFREAIEKGIGHGKPMGLGLLSIAPIP